MLSDIRITFENLEKKYRKLRQHLDSLTDEVLYFKAGADKWSVVEAIEHLVVQAGATGAGQAPPDSV